MAGLRLQVARQAGVVADIPFAALHQNHSDELNLIAKLSNQGQPSIPVVDLPASGSVLRLFQVQGGKVWATVGASSEGPGKKVPQGGEEVRNWSNKERLKFAKTFRRLPAEQRLLSTELLEAREVGSVLDQDLLQKVLG